MSDFDFDAIAPTFEKHVRGELPWYDLATAMVAQLVRAYLPHYGCVLDIGCATGNIGRAIETLLHDRAAVIRPIDSSVAMGERYNGPGRCEYGKSGDVRTVELREYDVIVSFLTLMFVRTTDRPAVFARLMSALRPGGVLLLFERFESAPGYPGLTLQRLGWAGKLAQGVEAKDIVAKELSLSGVQRPLAYAEIPSPSVRVFQYGDFAGFICPG